jgi:type VI secretion system secreted protein VgrG
MSAVPSALFPAGEPVRLETPEDLTGLVLHSAVVREELGRVYEIELVLEGNRARIGPQQVLGRAMAVLLNLDGTNARFFHGLVSEFRRFGEIGGRARYCARLRPWLWFLSKTQNCRIFQKLSVLEILKQVFRGHAFADFEEGQLAGSYEPREFVVQYRESDLAFVSRLMEDSGLHFYFRHARDRHTLVLCDAGTTHEAVPGYEVLPFQLPDPQRDQHLEYVDYWAAVHRVEASSYAAQHFDFERPNGVLVANGDRSVRTPGPLEVYDYPAIFGDVRQADGLATLALDRQECLAERFEGHSKGRGLTCGRAFTLSEHAWPEYNRAFLVVSSVTHISAHDLASTSVESGAVLRRDLVRCEFEAQDLGQPFVLPRATPRPSIAGAQTAIVSGPANQEIWTDAEGRVQLRFHWDRRRSGAEPASCWVRVSQLWAGAGFGAVHLPRVGDEVVVQFLDGDPDRPIVVGRVYNGTHEHPYDPGRTPNLSGIRSATIGGTLNNYNEIRFDDRKGAEQLRMQAERDLSLLVKQARSIEIGADDRLQIGGDRSIRVKGGLRVEVGEGASAGAAAPGNVVLVATQCIQLRCGQSRLELRPDRIELSCGDSKIDLTAMEIGLESGGKAKVTLGEIAFAAGKEGATLRLDGQATLSGETIKLNTP